MGERARLFVAVWPPDDVLEAIASLPRPDVAGLRWTTPDQWHATLRFIGSADVDEARGAFRSVAGARAAAVLGPSTQRFGQAILHVPVAGLDDLAAAVVHATADVGMPPDDRPFHGHLTLARVNNRRARVDLRPLTGVPVAGQWPVDEITLVRSHTSPRGARYEVIDRLALPSHG